MQTVKKFHIWMPNLFGFKGGIQVYSGYFLKALQELYPQSQYDVFLLHDEQALVDVNDVPQTNFYCTGQFPRSIRNLAYTLQLLSQGVLQHPDLIITTHLNFTPVAYWLKQITGIPYWTVAHGVEAWNIQRPALKNALKNADKILAVSNYTRDRLLKEQNIEPKKVVVLPNTVDTNRFQIANKPTYLLNRYHLKPHQPVILTVNRLCSTESYKSYDQVVQALPAVRKVIPDIHYIIVGKGDDQPRLEQKISDMKLQDCITLAGFVPDENLGDYYNLCDVFAMPSKLEGFGIVYLEAMACGKPTIGGNQDGAIDALCQGQLGALVNPDNTEEIAQILIQILHKTYPNP